MLLWLSWNRWRSLRDDACSAVLQCHPQCPVSRRPARALEVVVNFLADGGMSVIYRCLSTPGAIRIPDRKVASAAANADELWRSTCCELFFGAKNTPEYREFNFSPSGQWAVYGFQSYRQRDHFCCPQDAVPEISFTTSSEGWSLTASIPSALLNHVAQSTAKAAEVSVAVVLEAADGALSYWALTHPREVPDFHDRAGFILQTSISAMS